MPLGSARPHRARRVSKGANRMPPARVSSPFFGRRSLLKTGAAIAGPIDLASTRAVMPTSRSSNGRSARPRRLESKRTKRKRAPSAGARGPVIVTSGGGTARRPRSSSGPPRWLSPARVRPARRFPSSPCSCWSRRRHSGVSRRCCRTGRGPPPCWRCRPRSRRRRRPSGRSGSPCCRP